MSGIGRKKMATTPRVIRALIRATSREKNERLRFALLKLALLLVLGLWNEPEFRRVLQKQAYFAYGLLDLPYKQIRALFANPAAMPGSLPKPARRRRRRRASSVCSVAGKASSVPGKPVKVGKPKRSKPGWEPLANLLKPAWPPDD